jgi:cytochrome oxidase assembly protein ShyY1
VKRIPVLPTILVVLACAAMIGLGIWQLQRLHWKEGLLVRYAANVHEPPIALPRFVTGDDLLFRRASAFCLQPVGWSSEAGRDADGHMGWRTIAQCRTGAEGPGFSVQLGVAHQPAQHPDWKGGPVSGFITTAPNHAPLIAAMLGKSGAEPLMLVADTPPPGLTRNPGPDLSAIPNNHLAYAVQWFLFAGIAAVIYALALRKRLRG